MSWVERKYVVVHVTWFLIFSVDQYQIFGWCIGFPDKLFSVNPFLECLTIRELVDLIWSSNSLQLFLNLHFIFHAKTVSYVCHRHVVGVYLSFKSYQLKKEKRKNERKCFLVWQLNEEMPNLFLLLWAYIGAFSIHSIVKLVVGFPSKYFWNV